MGKIGRFVSRKGYWVLWLVLQLSAGFMLFNSTFHHRSLMYWGTGQVFGRLNTLATQVRSYMNLRQENEELLEKMARLEQEYFSLRRSVENDAALMMQDSVVALRYDAELTEEVRTAKVVNVLNRAGGKYYVIDKGSAAGVREDMPVLSAGGVVGMVMRSSAHYAVVMPIINSLHNLGCEVRGKGYQGLIIADGWGEGAYLGQVSLQADIQPGDTIQTHGNSYTYPRGMFVGVVDSLSVDRVNRGDAIHGVHRIKLGANFEQLRHVYVLLRDPRIEAQALEEETLPNE